jgi:hypothetical protein
MVADVEAGFRDVAAHATTQRLSRVSSATTCIRLPSVSPIHRSTSSHDNTLPVLSGPWIVTLSVNIDAHDAYEFVLSTLTSLPDSNHEAF